VTGLLTLQGGNEHTPGCEEIDRHLRETADTHRPLVVVVPLASSIRTITRTVTTALDWWRAFDVDVRVAPVPRVPTPRAVAVAADHPETLALVEDAWLIVLTGGVPDRLLDRLAGTRLWSGIVSAWHRGAHLSGSSSGAMVMGTWMQSVRPPFPLRAGLGLLDQTAVAPHHDLTAVRSITSRRAQIHPWMRIIGIAERTALAGRGDTFTVVGSGHVTLLAAGRRRSFHQGSTVRLEPVQALRSHPRTRESRLPAVPVT
jgi:cyanophycinase-like exopeptidase